ncbi:transport protein ATP-binding [Bordetella ansorpii]|uniref:Transport protein ATP-binding n=1 Tax=Bordetella ansorpii TaxID=288768 RepID=A0A157P9K9_9BORD|nr:zinc ABC transporter ATP-binding protein AztA [Bordetella ansorpii]SAI29934.1 transport protein ATP-binding [Bordetella ansorpii]
MSAVPLSPSSPADPCIVFDGLALAYRDHLALQGLSGAVQRGSLTAIVGPNGSGKTTLMKSIAGLLGPASGRCAVSPGLRVAYQPQLSGLDRAFPARVIDVVSLGLWPRRGLLGRHRQEDRRAMLAALDTVGLAGHAQRPVDTLSGGQLQRALFARTLLQDADLILLDEPFSAIDERTVRDLVGIIRRWHEQGRTVLVVVHDFDLVRQHFPETLLLAGCVVDWGATPQVLTPENIRRARQGHAQAPVEDVWREATR